MIFFMHTSCNSLSAILYHPSLRVFSIYHPGSGWHVTSSDQGLSHRYSRSRLLTHRSGGVTCMINPRWRGNRAKNYKTLQGNQCFSRFKASRCLKSLRINIFWKELIIAEILSTICINSAELLVKISLVKCVVNWSLGQFETFVDQNMYFLPALASWVLL